MQGAQDPTRSGRLKASLLAVSLAVLASACSSSGPPQFSKTDAENIRQVIQNLVSAYNAKDAAKTVALFSGGAVVMPPNASTMRGKDAVEQYYVARFAQGVTDLKINATDVSGEGKLAYASGDFSLNIVPPDGGPSGRDRGKFVFILRNLNGRWLLEYVIFSSDFPPQPAPAAAS